MFPACSAVVLWRTRRRNTDVSTDRGEEKQASGAAHSEPLLFTPLVKDGQTIGQLDAKKFIVLVN
jgi:putative methionine-R-sulfoxide reductase with GAF domain